MRGSAFQLPHSTKELKEIRPSIPEMYHIIGIQRDLMLSQSGFTDKIKWILQKLASELLVLEPPDFFL